MKNSTSDATVPAQLNRFLAYLPEADYVRLRSDLEFVSLNAGQTVYEPGENIQHIYFPIDCLISALLVSSEGTEVEVQTVGIEGCTGLSAILGARQSTNRCLAIVAGDAWRLPIGWFREEFKNGGAVHDFVLYQLHGQLVQSQQISLCHRLHTVEERLCRWLLAAMDATGDWKFEITHEMLAQLLGSRRPGVTIAANALRFAGLIEYQRGCIEVWNRQGLCAGSCECYQALCTAREATATAMLRRGGPINGTRYLTARQSDSLRAKSTGVRGRSQKLHGKIQALHGQREQLLVKSDALKGKLKRCASDETVPPQATPHETAPRSTVPGVGALGEQRKR